LIWLASAILYIQIPRFGLLYCWFCDI
jgi:hypothetical protein